MILLILSILTSLIPSPTLATTFGEIHLTRQLQRAPHIARVGIGERTVEKNPQDRLTHTYWEASVLEVFSSRPLEENIRIRQPGGIIDGSGSQVLGTASFTEGEESIVLLRDTKEDAKELIGLASGKYTITKNASGKEILKSGLGVVLKNQKNQIFRLQDFRNLMERIKTKTLTPGDKSITINLEKTHHNHLNNHKPPRNIESSTPTTSQPPETRQKDREERKERENPPSFFWWTVGALLASTLLITLALKHYRS